MIDKKILLRDIAGSIKTMCDALNGDISAFSGPPLLQLLLLPLLLHPPFSFSVLGAIFMYR